MQGIDRGIKPLLQQGRQDLPVNNPLLLGQSGELVKVEAINDGLKREICKNEYFDLLLLTWCASSRLYLDTWMQHASLEHTYWMWKRIFSWSEAATCRAARRAHVALERICLRASSELIRSRLMPRMSALSEGTRDGTDTINGSKCGGVF